MISVANKTLDRAHAQWIDEHNEEDEDEEEEEEDMMADSSVYSFNNNSNCSFKNNPYSLYDLEDPDYQEMNNHRSSLNPSFPSPTTHYRSVLKGTANCASTQRHNHIVMNCLNYALANQNQIQLPHPWLTNSELILTNLSNKMDESFVQVDSQCINRVCWFLANSVVNKQEQIRKLLNRIKQLEQNVGYNFINI